MMISCVMPTTNPRRGFLGQAVACFLAQTYQDKELIIVAGEETMGKKLNQGIERAKGSLIQKWDDDDYYGPEFLARVVRAFEDHPEATSVIWDRYLIRLNSEPEILRCSPPSWLAGGTLAFRRMLKPFREDIPAGIDDAFVWDHKPRWAKVSDSETAFVQVRHGANTWLETVPGQSVDDFYRTMPAYGN